MNDDSAEEFAILYCRLHEGARNPSMSRTLVRFLESKGLTSET